MRVTQTVVQFDLIAEFLMNDSTKIKLSGLLRNLSSIQAHILSHRNNESGRCNYGQMRRRADDQVHQQPPYSPATIRLTASPYNVPL